jgi:hypothetical protein
VGGGEDGRKECALRWASLKKSRDGEGGREPYLEKEGEKKRHNVIGRQ